MITDNTESEIWEPGEFENYLGKSGFKQKFDGLHPVLKEPVKRGIGALNRLGVLGKQITSDDKRILTGEEVNLPENKSDFRTVVENELGDIGRIYYGEGDLNWMNRSVDDLFRMANYSDYATRQSAKDHAFSEVGALRKRLNEAGINYQTSFSEGENSRAVQDMEAAKNYLDSARYANLDKMSGIETNDYLPVLDKLRPIDVEN